MKRAVSYIVSILIGGGLLYLALRGVPLDELGDAFAGAHYVWLLPLTLIILASHALRAWRWKLLIEALPEPGAPSGSRPVSFLTAFYSVLIGYLVNLVTPRLGEVVRSANLARQEKKRISGVVGTVVVERLLDAVVLASAIVCVVLLYLHEFAFINDTFLTPARGALGQVSAADYAWLALAGVVLLAAAYGAARRLFRSEHSLIRRLRSAGRSFRDGLYTLHRSPRRLQILVCTVAMWFGYTLMAYLPLLMLDLQRPYDLSLLDGFAIMIFGSLGIAVPSPGGTGSYHYVTKLAMVNLFGVDGQSAIVYALLAHGVQMVIYIVAGSIALVAQGVSWRVLRTDAVESPQKAL